MTPQWRVEVAQIPTKVLPRVRRYRIGFCGVASPTNQRSLVAALLPPQVVAGHKVPTIVLEGGVDADVLLWLAVANSLVVDYVVRRKVSLNMDYTIVDGLPIPRRADAASSVHREIVEIAGRLTCVSPEMFSFWDDLAASGWVPARSGQSNPGLLTADDRLVAKARLDAVVAIHLYGLDVDDMEIVLDDFKALANQEQREFGEFRTRRLVLAAMHSELTRRGVTRGSTPGDASAPSLTLAPPRPQTQGAVAPAAKPSSTAPPRTVAEAAPSLFTTDPTCAWRPEAAVPPSEMLMGAQVRHRTKGEGIVLSVRPSGKATELLIRFEAGAEAWIVLGYGVLEFQQRPSSESSLG